MCACMFAHLHWRRQQCEHLVPGTPGVAIEVDGHVDAVCADARRNLHAANAKGHTGGHTP